MKIISAVLLCAALSFSYQAQRDTLEPTDSISVSPLSGLRYINLLVNTNSSSTFLFQIDGDSSVEKVSYFGNNLANYVCNVESAQKKINEYKTLRFAQTGLLLSGIVLTAIGTTFTVQDGEVSPTILLGIGTAAFSWIPAYFTQSKIPEAIGNYNETIARHQKISAKTSTQSGKNL